MGSFTEQHYAVALSILSSPVTNRLWELVDLFSAKEVYQKIAFKKKLSVQNFLTIKYATDPFLASQQIVEKCQSKSIKIVTYWDKNYPNLLKNIFRPPLVLYYYGNLEGINPLSIVGTRKADPKSIAITKRISSELAQLSYTIVSGMAIGIDKEAHQAALDIQGRTIGVLANGLDIIYPVLNRGLYYAIRDSQDSSLISEYPPEIIAGKWTFARRNRIISGLSSGTIVIKAGVRSGTLITAKYALEQNREVFSCSGHAFDESYFGCHQLIREGATLVRETNDIVYELPGGGDKLLSPATSFFENDHKGLDLKKNSPSQDKLEGLIEPQDELAQKILEELNQGEKQIDFLVRKIDYPLSQIQESLIILEVSGAITRNGNLISKV